MKKIIKNIALVCSLFSFGILSVTAYTSNKLPNEFYVRTGEELYIDENIATYYDKESKDILASIDGASHIQTSEVTLKMFGVIPIKDVNINYIDNIKVVPCGTAFGIKMYTDGVVIIGTGEVESENGVINPAEKAGIKVGDVIVSINGEKVGKNEDVERIISSSDGSDIVVSIKRKNLGFDLVLTPIKSSYDNNYKGGLWVRDSSAGIGTMTYYSNELSVFGGLGHPICDVETGDILPLMTGEIVEVDITGVNKGVNGVPGELRGSFSSSGATGELMINSETGVFGVLNQNPTNHDEVEIGLRQEIVQGEASILCTLDENEPKEYKIVIDSVDMSGNNHTKNMVIRVTDPELLECTGGIVQGMSGSPILQNGKLIGAVTHVFVNDPTKGYGIFAENMIKTASQIQNKNAS